MRRPASRPRERLGYVLAMVLVCMLLTVALVGALQRSAWRALRGSRLQWDGQVAQHEASSALSSALLSWSADSAAASAIGAERRSSAANDRWQTETVVARTAPLIAIVRTRVQSTDNPPRIRRTAARTVWLQTPPLPLSAATIVLGALRAGGSQLDGRDLLAPFDVDGDDCGPLRDTASVAALRVANLQADSARLSSTSIPFDASSLARAQIQVDSAWSVLLRDAKPLALNADSSLAPSPWWQPRAVGTDSVLVLNGVNRLRGLVMVRGDLELRGTLEVEGLLLVRGAINSDRGSLRVRGALLVRDQRQRGSVLGNDSQVRYAPCEVGRALAGIARPRRGPFHQWNTP